MCSSLGDSHVNCYLMNSRLIVSLGQTLVTHNIFLRNAVIPKQTLIVLATTYFFYLFTSILMPIFDAMVLLPHSRRCEHVALTIIDLLWRHSLACHRIHTRAELAKCIAFVRVIWKKEFAKGCPNMLKIKHKDHMACT